MSTKLFKRLILSAALVFAVSFIFNRPLPSQGLDDGNRNFENQPPQIEQEGEETPEAEATEAPVAEGEETAPPIEGLQTVGVGIYVISFDELNLAESYYVMTFYLSLTCETACAPAGFEFTNGTANYIDLLIDDPLYKSYKAQVTFRENFNVMRFPFDSHELNVAIEDSSRTTERLVYVVNDQLTDIAPDVVISGWDLDLVTHTSVDDHFYPTFDETYSRYLLSINISRPWLSTIFKALLPILFILMLGYSLLLLGTERASDTLEIISGVLVGAILHHLYLSGLIPPTGYMTLMDAFMSVSYLLLVSILFIMVRTINLVDADKREDASRLHSRVLWLVPLALVVLQVGVFLLWFFVF